MPITFEQPGAFNPTVGQEGGQAQQWSRDFPTLQRQQQTLAQIYESFARLNQQQNQAGMSFAGQIAGQVGQQQQQAAQRAQQQQEFEQQQAMQAYQFAAQREPSARDVFQAQQQSAMQQQGASLQQQLQETQLSQAEKIRMQQLQNGLSELDKQHQDGTIDDATYNQGRMLLRSHLDPYQMRTARQQQLQQQLRTQGMMHEAAQQAALENENEAVRAQAIERRIIRRPNPDDPGGPPLEYFLDHRGSLQLVPRHERGQRGSGAAEVTPAHRVAVLNHVDQQLAAEEKSDHDAPAWAASPEARSQERRRRYEESLALIHPELTRPRTPQRPYDVQRPETMTDAQRAAEQDFDRLAHLARTAPGSEGWRIDMEQKAEEARGLIRRFGSESNMPPAWRRRFHDLLGALRSLPSARPAPPPAPPRPVENPMAHPELTFPLAGG